MTMRWRSNDMVVRQTCFSMTLLVQIRSDLPVFNTRFRFPVHPPDFTAEKLQAQPKKGTDRRVRKSVLQRHKGRLLTGVSAAGGLAITSNYFRGETRE